MKVLLNRKETVRLLILAELMKNPECNQRDIAKKLGITPQAVSEHFKELVSEGLINVVHKGYYVVTDEGKEWLNKNLYDLHVFTEDLLSKIYSSNVLAIAKGTIKEGDSVEYWFEDGFVYARKSENGNGVAAGNAEDGEEVLIKPSGAFTPPKKGEVVVFKVPMTERGGSKAANVELLKKLLNEKRKHLVIAMGLEALVTCRKAGVEPIFFGAKNVCIEAAHHGSGVIAVVTESTMEDLLRTLIEEGVRFDIVDGSKQKD